LKQVSDADQVAVLVEQVLAENPKQVASYLAGKETVSRWLFGQVMRLAKGQANPQVIQQVLDERLLVLKNQPPPEKM
jgi:aspartyl-tRNA(Asn)/glutamyl-tRNA(Gln) amidotransferase subunit B